MMKTEDIIKGVGIAMAALGALMVMDETERANWVFVAEKIAGAAVFVTGVKTYKNGGCAFSQICDMFKTLSRKAFQLVNLIN
ncbi:MAG: hypothetical protein NC204_05715 [Candidatus Amulumruptor caecigallinarius]|nr:hypothetical protein [Candidatus Amulumruptor caecigallinarius]